MLKNKQTKYILSLPAAATILLASSATAHAETGALVNAQDGTYISITGTVGRVLDTDEFVLKTTNGDINVDTNDRWPMLFNKTANQRTLTAGDKVMVRGIIDDNYFTKKEIDAESIAQIGSGYTTVYYYDTDNYDDNFWYDSDYYNEKTVSLSGSVAKIMDDDEFLLNYVGGGTIEVDAGDVVDDINKSLSVGDSVTVYGEVEEGWFNNRELDATSIYRQSVYR